MLPNYASLINHFHNKANFFIIQLVPLSNNLIHKSKMIQDNNQIIFNIILSPNLNSKVLLKYHKHKLHFYKRILKHKKNFYYHYKRILCKLSIIKIEK